MSRMRSNFALERTAHQRCLWVPSALCARILRAA
jgi:hypothetical protein